MSAHVCDEKYKRRSEALYKVFTGIPHKEPTPLSHEKLLRWLRHMSGELAHASITGDTSDFSFEGMNRKREREKLRDVQALARKLSREVRGLHPHVSDMLWFASAGTRYSDMLDDGSAPIPEAEREFWRRFWKHLAMLDSTIDKVLPEAEAWVNDAPELGKRERHIIAIVDVLRGIWRDVTGDDPPRYISGVGPFADFLAEAFRALELEVNPRAVTDSWREYRDKNSEKY